MAFLDDVGKKIGGVFGFNEEEDIRGGFRSAREAANRRADEKYNKFKVDPELLKKEYSQYVQNALQQQAGGLTSALSSQRRINPALAAHLVGNTQAQASGEAANKLALGQTQLGYQSDIYNKQLLQQLQQSELQGAQAEEAAYAQARQAKNGFLQNLIVTGATIGAGFLMPKVPPGGKGITGTASTFAPAAGFLAGNIGSSQFNQLPSHYRANYGSTGMSTDTYSDERLKKPYFSHDHTKDPSYHEMLASFHSENMTPHMQKMAADHKKFQQPNENEMQQFEQSLKPSKYAYKRGSVADDGGQEHVTPMAQNIEKSKIGKTVVKKDAQGYRKLDIPQLTSTLAGGIYDLNKRLQKLERKRA